MKVARLKAFDPIFFIMVLLLTVFGLIMVFSASSATAFYKFGDSYHFFKKQAIWAVAGIITLFIAANFDYRKLVKLSAPAYGFSLILLLLVVFVGREVNGAKRWLAFGGMTLQPSEIVKFTVVIICAYMLSNKLPKEQKFSNAILPYLLIIALPAGLLALQPHFSATVLICVTVFAMMIAAGIKFKFFTPFILGGSIVGALMIFMSPYRLKRITAFIDPFQDKLGTGWQIIQSLYAIGSGQIVGLGLGRSRQKFLYIPEPHNDFIFAIIGEELGFLGAVAVIALFVVLMFRGIQIATKAPDIFGTMLCTGIIVLVGIQALFNIAVATSSVPPTGVPLPFFSAGGSSFIFLMAGMGIILNVSRHPTTS